MYFHFGKLDRKLNGSVGDGLRFAAEEESLAESRSGKKRKGRRSMKREPVVGRATCATRRERGYKR